MKFLKYVTSLMIILGILIIFYPIISNYFNSLNQKGIISNYQELIQNMTDSEKTEKINQYNRYNNHINQGDTTSYINFYNIQGILGYISIPKINVNLPIYNGTSDEVLSKGVGNLENSSLPTGRKGNHCVLVAHTGLTNTKMFDNLNKLELEDKFYMNILDKKLEYQVDQIKVVTPDNTEDLEAEDDKDYITLVTCTPYMINSHRLLVRGVRMEEPDLIEKEYVNVNYVEEQSFWNRYFISLLCKDFKSNISLINNILVSKLYSI